MTLRSPYTPGSVPLVLAGRDAPLTQIRTQLGGVATYGQFVGRIRVETGPRGVGKTSLLKAVQDSAAEAGLEQRAQRAAAPADGQGTDRERRVRPPAVHYAGVRSLRPGRNRRRIRACAWAVK